MYEGYELELFIYEEMEKGSCLPVNVINSAQIIFGIDKRIIQQAMHEYQETVRKIEWCEKIGHNFVSESHAGPESGYESGYCKRCGWSFNHTFY